MRALKDKGVEDLQAIKARARKLHALGRLSKTTADEIIDILDLAETKIIGSIEYDSEGDEVG